MLNINNLNVYSGFITTCHIVQNLHLGNTISIKV